MKIVINCICDEWHNSECMEIDGKKKLYVEDLDECPEDALLDRDLVSCCDVSDFMKMAIALSYHKC